MRKGLFAVCLISLFMLWAAGTARAQSPHWITATVSLNTNDGSLDFKWKVAGLGGGVTVNFFPTADVVATYVCTNHGGNTVQGVPFQIGPVVESPTVTLTSSHNGTIRGAQVLDPPAAPADSCKGKFTPTLLSVTWSNAALSADSGLGAAPLTGNADCLSGTGCTVTF